MLEIINAKKYFNKGKNNQIKAIDDTTLSFKDNGLVFSAELISYVNDLYSPKTLSFACEHDTHTIIMLKYKQLRTDLIID